MYNNPPAIIRFSRNEIFQVVKKLRYNRIPDTFCAKLDRRCQFRPDLEDLHVYAVPVAYGCNLWCEALLVEIKTGNKNLSSDLSKNMTGRFVVELSHTDRYDPSRLSCISYTPLPAEQRIILHGLYNTP